MSEIVFWCRIGALGVVDVALAILIGHWLRRKTGGQ